MDDSEETPVIAARKTRRSRLARSCQLRFVALIKNTLSKSAQRRMHESQQITVPQFFAQSIIMPCGRLTFLLQFGRYQGPDPGARDPPQEAQEPGEGAR